MGPGSRAISCTPRAPQSSALSFPTSPPSACWPLGGHLSIGAQYLVGNLEEGLGLAGHVFEVELDCLALSAHAHKELAVPLVTSAELTLHLLCYNCS